MRVFFLVAALLFLWTLPCAGEKLAGSVKDVIKGLPGQSLTPEIVVGLGLENSASLQKIKANRIGENVSYLRTADALDWNFQLEAGKQEDRSEVTSSFSPEETKVTNYKFSAETMFSSGTSLKAKYLSSGSDLEYPDDLMANPSLAQSFLTEYSEGTFQLTLSQPLWRNAFGRDFRKLLQASELGAGTTRLEVQNASSQWALELLNSYYRAWMAQKNLKAAQSNLERQKRLLNITQIQKRRGTAKKSDVLQMRAAVVRAQNQTSSARQKLQDVWRRLIISLEAPAHWLKASPAEVPMQVDHVPTGLKRLCRQRQQNESDISNAKTRALKKKLKAKKLALSAQKNKLYPDLSLQLSMGTNSINDNFSGAWREVQDWKHPNYRAGIQLTVPWSNREARAAIAEARKEKTQAALELGQKKDDLRIEWHNGCENLERLLKQEQKLKNLVALQNRRVKEDERLFELGKRRPLEVIQAGRDAAQARVLWSETQVALLRQAWRLRHLRGQVKDYLNDLDPGGITE